MKFSFARHSFPAVLAAVFALQACGVETIGDSDRVINDTATPADLDIQLATVDELFDGAPTNDELPSAGKADATYPKKFDLMASQSKVKNQASRGVCSIFATVALMEHLYKLDGSLGSEPDFSEQYLQWSAKFEVNSFPKTSGSNALYNLQAINQYGIPEEGAWPYQTRQWGASNDPKCVGEEAKQPTYCFTNGHPPQVAVDAPKFFLPKGQWLNTTATSIKNHMVSKKTAVVVGVKFFYQAWNHGGSKLKTNNDYYRQGYVLYPNADDKKQEPAGHAILLVGWDDTLEVQKRDKDGKLVVDTNGKPVMEKGFYIFKNSWGTGSFGVNNAYGDGYGYISQRYVAEYGNAYVSAVPKIAPPKEICGDGIDNDKNGKTDCDDSVCSSLAVCDKNSVILESFPELAIPDNNQTGIKDSISVTQTGTVKALSVTVAISHTYSGDLTLKLKKGTKEVVLHEADGDDSEDLIRTFDISDFNGRAMKGPWHLTVIDEARGDVGTLEAWSLKISH